MQRFESSAFQAHISCPRTDVQLVRQGAVLTVSLSYRGAYGMGEKYDALNQKGRVVVNQVEEKFCFQGEKTYCPAPFFWNRSLGLCCCGHPLHEVGKGTFDVNVAAAVIVNLVSVE